MAFPFIVIDQNQLQRADLIAALVERCRSNKLHLLIPDGAGFEFSKGMNPHHTWYRCLQHIALFPEFIVVGRHVGQLWRDELTKGAASIDLIDQSATEAFRQLLSQIAQGDRVGIDRIMHGSRKTQLPQSLAEWSNHDLFKAMVQLIYDSLKSSLDIEHLKHLRKTKETGIGEWLSSDQGVRFVFQYIQRQAPDSETALYLTVNPSAISAHVSGLAALALDWLALGGFDTASPSEITNDLHDLEYAVIGALSNSLATADHRPNRVCNEIRMGFEGRAKWFASHIQ